MGFRPHVLVALPEHEECVVDLRDRWVSCGLQCDHGVERSRAGSSSVSEAAPHTQVVLEERGIRPQPHSPLGMCGFFIFGVLILFDKHIKMKVRRSGDPSPYGLRGQGGLMSRLRRLCDKVLYLQDVIRDSDGEYRFFMVLLSVGLIELVSSLLGAS